MWQGTGEEQTNIAAIRWIMISEPCSPARESMVSTVSRRHSPGATGPDVIRCMQQAVGEMVHLSLRSSPGEKTVDYHR